MKHIAIIGASSGIGLMMADIFARLGYRVGVAARRTEPLEELARKYPEQIVVSRIDIDSPDAPKALERLADDLGGLDIYCHVAGIGYDNPTLDPETEAKVIQTNAVGFVRMTAAAYRYIAQHGISGQIVGVTSVAGTRGLAPLAAYSASKKCASTYLVALEQRARIEKADISFTDIRPGWIRTPLLTVGHSYPMEMSLDYAVPLMVRAIIKKKRVAVIDWRWNIAVGLWRCIPTALWIRAQALAKGAGTL